MRSIESEGDTIDEAIDRALQALRVGRDQVEVEILADATRGLFGLGGKKARVRATMRAPLVAGLPPRDHRSGRDDSRETSVIEPADTTASRPRTPMRSSTVCRQEAGPGTCEAILSELLGHLGVSCTVTARPGDDPGMVVLDVTGDSGGLLIGRRGQTLDAIEYVVNRIVARHDEGFVGRVMIDVEHYRERRQEYLTTLAHRLADKVKQTGHVVTLNPMSPRDRRIVHLALQGDTAVVTHSEGEGHYRKLLILPADRVRRRRQTQSGD